MKRIASLAVTALLLSVEKANAASGTYSYYANGADWPLMTDTECMKSNQSPIDLRLSGDSYPLAQSSPSEASYMYMNFDNAKITNKGKTIQVDIPEQYQQDNMFYTSHAPEVRYGPEKFKAVQFHFHAQSEHTIEGKRYDMEMHIVHLSDEARGEPVPIFASALGFMFDVDDYDRSVTGEEMDTINRFFDSINFGNMPEYGMAEGHVLNEYAYVPLGDLQRLMSMAGRWVYTGSLTTPPCNVGVYFQVYDRVLPISRHHYDLYLEQQRRYMQDVIYTESGPTKADPPLDLSQTGNWRVINQVDNHNVYYLRDGETYDFYGQFEEGYDDWSSGAKSKTTMGAAIITACFALFANAF